VPDDIARPAVAAELVVQHIPLARRIARRWTSRLPVALHDDVLSDAMLGLVEAARSYSSDRSVDFAGYASRRIRGAIQDGGRRSGPMGRRSRWVGATSVRLVGFVEDKYAAPATPEPEPTLLAALERLPRREAIVLSLLYCEGMLLHEVGELLGVTESRACQIRMIALRRLREMLERAAPQAEEAAGGRRAR